MDGCLTGESVASPQQLGRRNTSVAVSHPSSADAVSANPRATVADVALTVHVAGRAGSGLGGSAVDEQRIVLAGLPEVDQHV